MTALTSLISRLFSNRTPGDPLQTALSSQQDVERLAARRYRGWLIYLMYERRRLETIVKAVESGASDSPVDSVTLKDARDLLEELDASLDAPLSPQPAMPPPPVLTTTAGVGTVTFSPEDDLAGPVANPTTDND